MRIRFPTTKGFLEAMLVTIAVTAVLLFVVWQLASATVPPESGEMQQNMAFLGRELEAVSSRMDRLQARQAVVEKEAEVLRRANRLLRENESRRQADLGQMQAQLDFYQRLAGSGEVQAGLDIYQAQLVATDSERVFQFILTLTQNIRRASMISGRVRMDIEGTLDNRPVTLRWAQISDGETPEPAFRFKYFQQLEGYLTIPEGFSATRMILTLEARNQRKPVVRKINWNELRDN